jgi:hypothetical protein
VNDDQYHFDGPGQREFGKRFAAAYLQAIKSSTGIPHGSGAQATWRLRARAGFRTLEFAQAQDRILISIAQGKLIAAGSGRTLRLPSTVPPGLLFFKAETGTRISRGTLVP